MNIKNLNLEFGWANHFSNDYKPKAISSEELEKYFSAKGIPADLVLYIYATGFYCGVGQMLFRANGKWYHYSMSHCSCYGPMEHLNPIDESKGLTLNELKATFNEEYLKKEVQCLFDVAEKIEKGE